MNSGTKRTEHELKLDSFEVKGFRAFRHLTIERLGRVNLFVGKNNSGKTSLLEAIALYADGGHPRALWDSVVRRGEAVFHQIRDGESGNRAMALRYAFHGFPEEPYPKYPIEVGQIQPGDGYSAQIIALYSDPATKVLRIPIDLSESVEADWYMRVEGGWLDGSDLALEDDSPTRWQRHVDLPDALNHILLPATGSLNTSVSQMWDDVALTDLEDRVVEALRIIIPDAERIALVGNGIGATRVPTVRLASRKNPIAFGSLGEGMNRLFTLSLALVNAKDGVLLVDEIEGGIHYSVLADVWRLVFRLATRLNVQVFATTHSWDCIEAFRAASAEHLQDGLLIRLETENGEATATIFDDQMVDAVVRRHVEVR